MAVPDVNAQAVACGACPAWCIDGLRGDADHKLRNARQCVLVRRAENYLLVQTLGCSLSERASRSEHEGHTKRSQHSQCSLRLKAEWPIICLQITAAMMPSLWESTAGVEALAQLQAGLSSWGGRALPGMPLHHSRIGRRIQSHCRRLKDTLGQHSPAIRGILKACIIRMHMRPNGGHPPVGTVYLSVDRSGRIIHT